VKENTATLYYAHDPMCSWCWAFRPIFSQVLRRLPTHIKVEYLLGGLAPDSDEAMDKDTQAMIQHHWHTIEKKVPNTTFNFDFWTKNTPKRSTYPACRAVLAAKAQNKDKETALILAIQQAYYLHAQNPSHDDTLIACAGTIGLDIQQFQQDLHSPIIQQELTLHIKQIKRLGIRSFPSLMLQNTAHKLQPICIDYNNAESILTQLHAA